MRAPLRWRAHFLGGRSVEVSREAASGEDSRGRVLGGGCWSCEHFDLFHRFRAFISPGVSNPFIGDFSTFDIFT